MISALGSFHRFLARVGGFLQSPLLLAVRLYWGWQFFQTGKGKLMNLDRTANFFASLHIPAPKLNAMMAGGTECFGGLLLLLGLWSRFVSPALICVMAVAYATADRDALLQIFAKPDKFLGADPFLFLFAAVIVFVFGPGRIALDALIFKRTPAAA